MDLWIQLEQLQGNVNRPHPEKAGQPYKIKDLQAFKSFVETTPFSQAKDLVPLFEQRFGYSVSYANILFVLKKLGWSHKKRVFFTDKPAKYDRPYFNGSCHNGNSNMVKSIFYILMNQA